VGVSTSPEVELLEATFHPQPGDTIPWEAITETLQLEKTVARFRSIHRAWARYHLQMHNWCFTPLPGIGMHMCLEYERLGGVRKELHGVHRAMGRVVTHAESIQVVQLSEPQRVEAQHLQQATRRVLRATADEARRLEQIPRVPAPAPARPPMPVSRTAPAP
jgi:hypothetical protein